MKKNILISVYDLEIGGIERSLINMLESFNFDKYQVDLLIYHHSGEFLKLIPDSVHMISEVGEYSVFRKPIPQCLKEGYYFTSLIRLICKPLANIKAGFMKLEEGSGYIQMQLAIKYASRFLPKLKKNYDVAISFAWPHDILAEIVNADKKIAWIHTDYSKLEIDHKQDLRVWGKFDYIASVSEDCTRSFLSVYPSLESKIIEIENITSPEFIKYMAEETKEKNIFDKDAFNIVSVGRLSYVKGFDMAVEALRKLHDRGYTDINWFIVGYGGFEKELTELIKENNLEDSFKLLGKKTNPYPYIKASDLYVQPSRYEGKAVTVTEAKILAKPIIITNYPTANSQIIDGTEGLICGLNAEGMAEAIEKLYHNHELRMNLSNSLRGIDFSNESELEKLYSLFGDGEALKNVI